MVESEDLVLVNEDGVLPPDWPEGLDVIVIPWSLYLNCAATSVAHDVAGLAPGPPTDFLDQSGFSATNLVGIESDVGAANRVTGGNCSGNDIVGCTEATTSIDLYSFPAYSTNKPSGRCNSAAMYAAAGEFVAQFYLDEVRVSCLLNSWTGCSGCDQLDHFTKHWDGLDLPGDSYGVAWVKKYKDNGVAVFKGETALAAEECTPRCVDWGHAQIVQHEVSHLFHADDKGTWCNQGTGIMNYCHAYHGKTYYDQDSVAKICAFFGTCGGTQPL